jgi:hypothetical protein
MTDLLQAEIAAALTSADPQPDPFRKFDLAAFLDEDPPEHDYLLDGMFEYGEIAWLSGRGKAGKSMIALFLMNACLDGSSISLGRDVGHVEWGVYIDAENREATVRRRVHLAGMGHEVARRIEYRSVRGIDLGSREGLDGLRRLCDRPGRGLVVLDSLVALHRADENQAVEVRQFVDKLRAVFEQTGVTALGLGHENRQGNMRASLDWRNAVDRVLNLTKEPDGSRKLANGVRDGPDDDGAVAFKFTVTPDQFGMPRMSLESLGTTVRRATRSKAEQLSDHILLLLRGDPTWPRAKVAHELGFDTQHGTFKRAWNLASDVLAKEGQDGPA